jgi:HK97 family phage major capsid protein
MATFADLISTKEAELASKRALAAAFVSERAAILAPLTATESLTDEAQARFDSLTESKRAADAAILALDAKLVELRAESAADDVATRAAAVVHPSVERVAPAVVGSEPRTYSRGTATEGTSFIRDMYMAERSDRGAISRIERHRVESEVHGEVSKRAGTTGGFAGLVPPQYLVDQAALVARAGRPFANIVQHLELPPTGMQLIIPRSTTGVTAAVQASENSSVSNTDEVWANVTVPIVTVAAQQDLSRQSIERGEGIDSLVILDIAAAYAVQIDRQALIGSGTSGQMLGLLTTSGIGTSTAYGAVASASLFYRKLLGAINQIQTARFYAPTAIVMHPQRWNWLLSQVDSQGRPLAVPNMNGPFNTFGIAEAPTDPALTAPSGWVAGLPVITDANIPTNIGTNVEDQVVVLRKEDAILWEQGDGSPINLRFEQTLGNQLTIKLVAYNFAAFTAGRFPAASSSVGGVDTTATYGQVAPTF